MAAKTRNKLKALTTYLLLAILLISQNSYSQGLFEYFNWSAYSDGAERIDHLVLDFNTDRIIDLPNGVEQGYVNFGIDVYMFHDHPINKKGTLAYAIGIGYSGVNIHHNAMITQVTQSDGSKKTELIPYPSEMKPLKNKLNLNFLEVPLEIRIRTMKESEEDRKVTNFRFYMGFKVGVLVNSHTKYRDQDSKIKTYFIKDLNLFRYGPTLRIGFKKIGFYGFYSMTSIFEDGRGPVMQPYTLGLTWMRL